MCIYTVCTATMMMSTTTTQSPLDTLYRLVIFLTWQMYVSFLFWRCVLSPLVLCFFLVHFLHFFYSLCGRAHTCAPTEMLGFNTLWYTHTHTYVNNIQSRQCEKRMNKKRHWNNGLCVCKCVCSIFWAIWTVKHGEKERRIKKKHLSVFGCTRKEIN